MTHSLALILSALAASASMLLAGCGHGSPPGPQGSAPGDAQLKAERTGAEGGCLFNARGAVSDTYPCTGFTVLADGSNDSGETILEFSPGAGKTTASGAVVLPGGQLRVGEYELKDVKEAVFTITTGPDNRVSWICQAGVSGPTLGALKLRITSIDGSATFGNDTSYTAHGVFEALLIGVAPAGTGTAVLHGEF